MAEILNPALKEFVAHIENELVLAQVLIQRSGAGYELRQVEDRAAGAESLRLIKPDAMRAVAQVTATGEFRPLKSAPTLQRGWRLRAQSDAELETALSQLYPGAVADWHATRATNPPVTNYREYTNRQSGMYRITTMLNDAQVAQVIGAVCEPKSCLKRRWWTVTGLRPDSAADKSLIPCLEPCAVLMEAARKAMRAEQQEKLAADAPAG